MPALGNALDFQKHEARNLRSHQLAAAPPAPVAGQQYYNTTSNTLYWWNGSAWQAAGGTDPALEARVAALEAQVATLQAQMTGHTHTSGTIDAMGGPAVMP
jgi:hypothetical protein